MADLSKLTDEQLQVYREMLAKKQGENPPPLSLTPGTPGSEIPGRFAGAVAEGINPLPAVNALMHPINTARGMFDYTSNAIGRARNAKTPGEAIKSGIGAIPLVGPAAEQITREATEGQMPEALGHVAAIPLAGEIPKWIGRGLGAVAPGLAEKAMGITANDRKFGAQPGKAILEQTSGIRPARVAESAENRILGANADIENAVHNSPVKVSLLPARNVVSSGIAKARAGNAAETAHEMEPMGRFLETPTAGFAGDIHQPPAPMVPVSSGVLGPNGQPLMTMKPGAAPPPVIAPAQPAESFLRMRRGFESDYGPGSWTASTPSSAQGLFRQTYHTLSDTLHHAIPETLEPDTTIHNLIPVVRGAEAMGRREGMAPRIMTRIEKPTGALVPAALGYATGGAPGAALGAAIPEALSSPSARMVVARGLHGTGKGLQSLPLRSAARAIPLVNLSEEADQRANK